MSYNTTMAGLSLFILKCIFILFILTHGNCTQLYEERVMFGKPARFDCSVKSKDRASELDTWWEFNNKTISEGFRFQKLVSKSADGNVSTQLTINSVQWTDSGVYSCVFKDKSNEEKILKRQNIFLHVYAAPQSYETHQGTGKVGESSEMSCSFRANPLPKIHWLRQGTIIEKDVEKYEITTEKKSDMEVKSYLKILNLHHDDNGTFICQSENDYGSAVEIVNNLIFDKPEVTIDYVRAVDKDKLYLNWTVAEWNSPIMEYTLSYRMSEDSSWLYFLSEEIPSDETNFVLKNLSPNTEYFLRLSAKNKYGSGEFNMFEKAVRTLDFTPEFVPRLTIKGITKNSISIGWSTPVDAKIKEHIDYYNLVQTFNNNKKTIDQPLSKYSTYLWRNLDSATNYTFTVSACNQYTRECGIPSEPESAVTEDGLSGPPSKVEIHCLYDNISGMNYADVVWDEPYNKNGQIEFYHIELRGDARYLDATGESQTDIFGPKNKTEDSDRRHTRFDFLNPNTNYTAKVCAVTRRKECGQSTVHSCKMRQTPPRAEHLNQFQWFSDFKSDHPVFRLRMPRLSERNGRICCLRVIVVKLPHGHSSSDLPHQSELKISSYRKVHMSPNIWGAYIAEILGSSFMGKDVLVGDGQNILSAHMGGCPACQTGIRAHLLQAAKQAEQRRYLRAAELQEPTELVEDGPLSLEANYTAFVELIIPDSNMVGRSPYMSPRRPGDPVAVESSKINTIIVSVVGLITGLIFVILTLLLSLMLLKRYSKKVAATQGGVEMSLRRSFRHFCTTIRGRDHSQYLITPEAPKNEIGPIPKDNLVNEFLERHKDSDYGFQAEFEMLADSFQERSTEYCDDPANRPKNRYPDIKCYDQTRVKLQEIEGREKSDYINANYVLGYKERKRWICAQGPLEHTIADFWRMVYEQDVEIIIMLTNLEEYNRVKCAQYWPQAGDLDYCNVPVIINVAFVTETRYSDYIVRELLMTITKGETKEKRTVYHYHYLQWKDFNAPEHAPGMLKFIKRINEAWSGKAPMVVHCSAGVGRSGTLIAIDSLIQELDEEGEVKIFQFVCTLRQQRNYLVQSVKQYMFVYRAIMEMSQFGDTEIEAGEMKEKWLKLSSNSTKLEEEFQKLSCIVDDKKLPSVGANEENKVKNQSETVIPYDRNRVILTPDGMKPHSTYINASFIEGYYNDESFIITQDPLPSTCEDFWRMVTEHSIYTMVMLSSDKSWNYWEEGEAQFGSLNVRLTSTENFPSYVKRDFNVYNTKAEEEIHLTHFTYNLWTGDENEDTVPPTTHSFLDLIEHATAHKNDNNLHGPIAVHCRYGSTRSSVYVALSCLIQQIKNEKRSDVFTAVRKLRSQRQGMVQSLNHYKFIYRALCDYIDLYRNKDEEYDYSIPINALNGKAK